MMGEYDLQTVIAWLCESRALLVDPSHRSKEEAFAYLEKAIRLCKHS